MSVFPTLLWVLVIVSAVLCSIGFYRFVWFMSVGYGLAVAGCGLAMAIAALTLGQVGIPYLLLCLLIVIYGCRLGLFLLIRELKNTAYKKTLDAQTKPVPFFVKVCMWAMMAFLYPFQLSGALYRLANGQATASVDYLLWIGILITALGIFLEAAADKQKSEQKKVRPEMAATQGLFRLCRCPNYFGEILFWTGIFISGIPVLRGAQWIIALIGYVTIVYIMFSGAKRLEKRQNKNYGDKDEYRKYAATTPILIPFVPVYHLTKEEWGI